MNILLINHYAGSNAMGMEFRPYYLAREWIKQGHQVVIFAGDYSHLRKTNPVVTHDFEEQDIEGIKYIWIKTKTYQGNGFSRALTMFRFVYKLRKKAKWIAEKYQPDIIINSSTYPIDTYVGQAIRKHAPHAKLIHEIHDMWPATLIELGNMSKHNPFVQIMAMGEKSFCKHADIVISYLPFTKDYLVKHGLAPEKWYYIPNGVVLSDWENKQPLPTQHQDQIESFRQDKTHLVGYFGGHAMSNHLDTLLDVAKICSKQIGFVLMGDGVEKKRLMARAKQEQIENVLFLEPVNKLAVPSFLDCIDICYIGGKNSPLYRFGGSLNKMYDALNSGKPIVLAMNLPGNPIEESQGKQLIVLDDNVEKIKTAIEQACLLDEQQLQQIAQNSRKSIVERYNYSIISKEYEHLMTKSDYNVKESV